jgi:hypothetical protein
MFQRKVVKKIKTHILRSITSSRKSCRLWDNMEKYDRVRKATDNNRIRRMRIACCITKATDTNLYNTYWFSMATMVTRTHLDVTIIRTFPLLVNYLFYTLAAHRWKKCLYRPRPYLSWLLYNTISPLESLKPVDQGVLFSCALSTVPPRFLCISVHGLIRTLIEQPTSGSPSRPNKCSPHRLTVFLLTL